jgi:hypothetical protein
VFAFRQTCLAAENTGLLMREQSSFISQQANANLITVELFVPYLQARQIKLIAECTVY